MAAAKFVSLGAVAFRDELGGFPLAGNPAPAEAGGDGFRGAQGGKPMFRWSLVELRYHLRHALKALLDFLSGADL